MIFELTVLGSSSALPTSTKFSTAHVLNIHERFFLIDCGEGTQIQLRRAKIKFGRINHVFISHMHGDHVFGLFGVLSTFNLLGRTSPIHIYGPAELSNLIDFYIRFFARENTFVIEFHPLNNRALHLIFEDKLVEVCAFPLKHRIPTYGFLFREKKRPLNLRKEMIARYNLSIMQIKALKAGEDIITDAGLKLLSNEMTEPAYHPRSFAFCSDTMYYAKNIEYLKQVDLLYHESTFLEADKDLSKLTGHSTAGQAATFAKRAEVKRLLIGHFSNRYSGTDLFLDEARKIFPATEAAEELKCYRIPPGRIS